MISKVAVMSKGSMIHDGNSGIGVDISSGFGSVKKDLVSHQGMLEPQLNLLSTLNCC